MNPSLQRIAASGRVAALLAALAALVLLTPYCGWLFECGCTWPWAGLEAKCNIYDPEALHACPWCASVLAGALATLASVGAAALVAGWGAAGGWRRLLPAVLAGTAAFAAVGFAAGWLAALATGYPHFAAWLRGPTRRRRCRLAAAAPVWYSRPATRRCAGRRCFLPSL